MKTTLLALVYFLTFLSFGQDSLRSQKVDEVSVSHTMKKEIAFKDSKYFIIDFHIGVKGSFLLLNRFKKYYLYSLNYKMELEHQIELKFKPVSLFRDCLGFVHVMSKDSMYQIEKFGYQVVLYERNPISLYLKFFKNCIGQNDSIVIFERTVNYGKTQLFYGVRVKEKKRYMLYRAEDSLLVRSVLDEKRRIRTPRQGTPTLNEDVLKAEREHAQRAQFFQQIVSLPDYNPLFVKNDTTYIFDHLKGELTLMTDTGSVLKSIPIDYHQSENWNKKVHLDENRGRFYSVDEKNGAQIFCRLNPETFDIDKSTKVYKHAYPKKVIVFNGFAYYTYKENVDDNLNKLFRQRI
ncbi:MAG: hypothetical protein ACJA0U_000555 [Salibacteraceae bacterium]|jgi:hypothetical protein